MLLPLLLLLPSGAAHCAGTLLRLLLLPPLLAADAPPRLVSPNPVPAAACGVVALPATLVPLVGLAPTLAGLRKWARGPGGVRPCCTSPEAAFMVVVDDPRLPRLPGRPEPPHP